MLWWTLGWTCLFQIWFPRCVCPKVVLLGHMAVLFPIFFKEISILFSIVAVLVCIPTNKTEKETQMYRTDFWILWEKARVGCFERTALKHVYYQGWNRSPAQLDAWDKYLGLVHWEDPERWGIHVNPWLIHVIVWQKPLQYYKVISLQLIKINGKKNLKIIASGPITS